jgi:hypothetical protein
VRVLADRRKRLRNEEVLAQIFEADPALIALGQLVCLYGSDEELSTKLPWLDWPNSAPRTMRPNTRDGVRQLQAIAHRLACGLLPSASLSSLLF